MWLLVMFGADLTEISTLIDFQGQISIFSSFRPPYVRALQYVRLCLDAKHMMCIWILHYYVM